METYGSLGKEEKVDFILEQIRLTMAKKDFIRTFIIARKVRMNVSHVHLYVFGMGGLVDSWCGVHVCVCVFFGRRASSAPSSSPARYI